LTELDGVAEASRLKGNLRKVATRCKHCSATTCVQHMATFCFDCCDVVLKDPEVT
jgi:hypothetical protein